MVTDITNESRFFSLSGKVCEHFKNENIIPEKESKKLLNVWLALLGSNDPEEVYSAVISVFFNLPSE